jgi:hypothetical protein
MLSFCQQKRWTEKNYYEYYGCLHNYANSHNFSK